MHKEKNENIFPKKSEKYLRNTRIYLKTTGKTEMGL